MRTSLETRFALMSSIVIVELAGIFLRKSRRVAVGVKRPRPGRSYCGAQSGNCCDLFLHRARLVLGHGAIR